MNGSLVRGNYYKGLSIDPATGRNTYPIYKSNVSINNVSEGCCFYTGGYWYRIKSRVSGWDKWVCDKYLRKYDSSAVAVRKTVRSFWGEIFDGMVHSDGYTYMLVK